MSVIMLPSKYLILEKIKLELKKLNSKKGLAKIPLSLKLIFLGVLVVLILPLALFTHLFLSSLNLLLPVRIGTLNAKGRISIMLAYIEPFVRKLRLEYPLKNQLIIVINPGKDPNEQLTKMYKRELFLVDSKTPMLRFFFTVLYLFFAAKSKIHANLKHGHKCEFARAWQEGRPVMKFTKKELKKGEELLRNLGIPEGKEFVCISLRESEYYKQFQPYKAQAQANNLNVEAYADTFIRNPPLEDYLPTMKMLTEQGFYVVRMGQVTSQKIPKNLSEKIIDYVSKNRTSFGDVFLFATCKFMIAGGAPGSWLFSSSFNKPVIISGNYAFEIIGVRKGDLTINNKLFWNEKRSFFTFKELIKKSRYYSLKSTCEKDGVKLFHNTPEEINDVVQEMVQKLNNTWKITEKDELLQQKFNKLLKPIDEPYGLPGKIGAKFLRKYEYLIK